MMCLHCKGTGVKLVGVVKVGDHANPILAPCSDCDAVEIRGMTESPLASAERHAATARTNEEIVAGFRANAVKACQLGVLVVCLNDPALTEGQRRAARKLMQEIYGK